MRINKFYQSGFSLIEVMVAMVLLTFLLLAVVSLVSLSVTSNLSSRAQGAATKYSTQEMERIRARRDKKGLSAIDCYSPTQCVVDDNLNPTLVPENVNGTFTRYYQTQDSPDCTITSTPGPSPTPGGSSRRSKLITVYVTWQDNKGNHQSMLSSCLTDWQQQ